ncbi:hypothetical protein ACTVZO_00230 [Streptomyces sp. IBSNAI002]|uniref:hypothetical protein n=1 Tax=Streptomyces sp. IBSNAI002 TaxID=3457500 RepID=UPI003FCF6D4C
MDIVKTILEDDETTLTDTSSRRRQAQQTLTDPVAEVEEEFEEETGPERAGVDLDDYLLTPAAQTSGRKEGWDFDMPDTVIDSRHYEAVHAARSGRYAEASELAVIGEAQDIRAYGINSSEALSWLSTRAVVAELGGRPDTATQLRATVTRMGGDIEWWDKEPVDRSRPQAEHRDPLPPNPTQNMEGAEPTGKRRRPWLFAAVVAALALTTVGVWHKAETDRKDEARQQKVAAYKGTSGGKLTIDDVEADVLARWTRDHDHVIVELRTYFDPDAKYLRIEAAGANASSTRGEDRYTRSPELELPVTDPLADVTVRIEIGGKNWKQGEKGTFRTIRLSPTGEAFDADTGNKLPRAV